MSSIFSRAPAPREEKTGKDAEPPVCGARDCPLRPTIFEHTSGGRALCRYHNAAPSASWPFLTHLLRSKRFTRMDLEPGLVELGLRWMEDTPSPVSADYREQIDAEVHPGAMGKDVADFYLKRIAALRGRPEARSKDWAQVLVDRYIGGESLLPSQIGNACDALGMRREDLNELANATRARRKGAMA